MERDRVCSLSLQNTSLKHNRLFHNTTLQGSYHTEQQNLAQSQPQEWGLGGCCSFPPSWMERYLEWAGSLLLRWYQMRQGCGWWAANGENPNPKDCLNQKGRIRGQVERRKSNKLVSSPSTLLTSALKYIQVSNTQFPKDQL